MNRIHLIQKIINKFNYKRYLEIGVSKGRCFNRIRIESKEWVDPNPADNMKDDAHGHIITSDNFFMNISDDTRWDIIFIDGLHIEKQCTKDINNALDHLAINGTIIVHDCNPIKKEHATPQPQTKRWNGDVWKSLVKIRHRKDLKVSVINADEGIGIIRKIFDYEYDHLENNRKDLLNLIEVPELNNSLEGIL